MPTANEMGKKIWKGPPSKFVDIHEKGIGWKIFECMKENQDNLMQMCVETGTHDLYKDVLSRAIRTALEMTKRGVTSKDLICMCSLNHLNSCVPILASIFLNCKIACLDPTISESDTKHLINQVKPKMIFIDQHAEDLITNVLHDVSFKSEVISFSYNSKYERFINFLKANPDEEFFKPAIAMNLKETILIFFSSGTTGLPKGICLNHYGLMKQMNFGKKAQLEALMARMMSFASHYWISTFAMMYNTIKLGTCRVIISKFDRKKAWETINVFKPTCIFGAPCQILELLDGKGVPEGIDASSIKMMMIGGHSASPEQYDYIRSQFPKAYIGTGYGQTEASGSISNFDLSTPEGAMMMFKKKLSCGTFVADMTYKVVDPETEKVCGPNEEGELRIKADYLMNGYYNVDSSNAWDEEGFLKTGDVVYIDEDNYIFIVDRIKEMLKYKSWHVVPARLEGVIVKHPDVVNAVVFGIPHELDGDHPAAAVTVKEGSTVTASDIQNFANEQLDDRQQLRGGVTILEDFPKTPTGKVIRRKLRDFIMQMNK